MLHRNILSRSFFKVLTNQNHYMPAGLSYSSHTQRFWAALLELVQFLNWLEVQTVFLFYHHVFVVVFYIVFWQSIPWAIYNETYLRRLGKPPNGGEKGSGALPPKMAETIRLRIYHKLPRINVAASKVRWRAKYVEAHHPPEDGLP